MPTFPYAIVNKVVDEERQKLIIDEYTSPTHEVVIVVRANSKDCAAVATFLQDCKVKYFRETFPTCCAQDIEDSIEKAILKSAFAALHCWRNDLTMAEAVHLLIDDKEFILSTHSDSSLIRQKIMSYESQHSFKLHSHWTQNYLCDQVSTIFLEDFLYFFSLEHI